MLTIRRATAADIDAVEVLNADVQALHAAQLPALFKPVTASGDRRTSELRSMLNASQCRVLLPESDGIAVGYAYAEVRRRPESELRFADDTLYFHHLSVQPSHQGRGVGRALMDAVRKVVADEGIAHVELDVWTFNERARRFFAAQGFVPFNERLWNREERGDLNVDAD